MFGTAQRPSLQDANQRDYFSLHNFWKRGSLRKGSNSGLTRSVFLSPAKNYWISSRLAIYIPAKTPAERIVSRYGFGASEATILSKRGSLRSGSQNGCNFNWP
jgi:hypothetical protein